MNAIFKDAFPTFMKKQKEDRLIPTVGDLRAAHVRIKILEKDKTQLKKVIVEMLAEIARLTGNHI